MAVDNKISALIELLDDPDERVYHQVNNELMTFGNHIIPVLEDVWESSFNATLQERIEELIHNIQFECMLKDFKEWTQSEDKNVLEAALIISRYQYPDLNVQFVYDFIDQLTQDVWLELNNEYTAMEKAQIMNNVFFRIYGFHGNKKNFHAPRNTFLNKVLESRCGNPLSLSIIYLEVARRLNIPIYGVNLPSLFIMAYLKLPINFIDKVETKDILFYLNTFNKGAFFQIEDINNFLHQIELEPKAEYMLPCDEVTMVKRMLNNLILSFDKSGYSEKVKELKILINCMH